MQRFGRWLVVMGLLFCHGAFAQTKVAAEDAAYAQMKPGSLGDLKAFADKFPNAKSRASVLEAIAVLEDFQAIRDRTVTPKCEIPFSGLGKWTDGGQVWETYRTGVPGVEGAGFYMKGGMRGIFAPIAGTGHSISVGKSGVPYWPAGDGSVWGIGSDGNVAWLFPGLKIKTSERTLLGVIADRGLVCLRGSGTFTLVDENNREVAY